jgi:hypothetical protein
MARDRADHTRNTMIWTEYTDEELVGGNQGQNYHNFFNVSSPASY